MGVSSEKPERRASCSRVYKYQVWNCQGLIAPALMDNSLSGITRSGSISSLMPRPVHFGQAPCGLLKLKVRGAISPRLTPQLTQAKCSEKSNSSPSTMETSTTPDPSLSAVSTES